jgi:hypothetical protein
MRRYDCHLAFSGSFALSLVPRYLACFSGSWYPQRAQCLAEAPRHRQGLWSPGPPVRDMGQGDRWLSQVPEFPLWTHAPLSDPGGVLRTRPRAPRTAAFQPLDTVGFPTTLHFSGVHHAACVLATPGFVRPFTGRHAGSLLTCWLDVSQVGLAPTGKHQPISWVSPNPKVSGLPWRDQCFVRRRMCEGGSPYPQSPRTAVPTTPPDGLSSRSLRRCMPQTSRRQSHPESEFLLRERDLPLCPFPEREAGRPVLIHVPFKDVRHLVETR